MTNEELNTKLYKKMFAELDQFKKELSAQPFQAILDRAYEYCIKSDILLAVEDRDLTNAYASALLKSDKPLDDVFQIYDGRVTDHMEHVFDCLEECAAGIIQKENLRNTLLYMNTGAYAREHGELEKFRASHKANVACKNAIEDAIRENYRDNRLDDAAAKQVMDAFGPERTSYVLAATVQDKDWDARISRRNKEWAKAIPLVENVDAWGNDHNMAYVVSSHSGLIDLFILDFRKEVAALIQGKQKKPSVLNKLQAAKKLSAATQSKKKPAKDMEL